MKIIKNLEEIQNILYDDDKDFELIDNHYKFHGVDHDMWEFEAIVKRIEDNRYFSFRWFDNYSCGMRDMFDDDEIFELKQVYPKTKLVTIYE